MARVAVQVFEHDESFVFRSPQWGRSSVLSVDFVEGLAELLRGLLGTGKDVDLEMSAALAPEVILALRHAGAAGALLARSQNSLRISCPEDRAAAERVEAVVLSVLNVA